MLEVTFYAEDGVASQPIQVEFVSLISPETYGPPALIWPRDRTHKAEVGQTVLYVPTGPGACPFSIKRISDA